MLECGYCFSNHNNLAKIELLKRASSLNQKLKYYGTLGFISKLIFF